MPFQCFDTKVRFQSNAETVIKHIATEPVNDSHQVNKTFLEPDVRSCRDRNKVRVCVGQRLPLFPLFPASWQRYVRPCITFPQAHFLPGRSDFPSPVGSNSFSVLLNRFLPSSETGQSSEICPPFTDSSFARAGCYLLRCDLKGHIERHYPFLIATSNSCARPKSTHSLGLLLCQESLQVVANPCWKLALPNVAQQIFLSV